MTIIDKGNVVNLRKNSIKTESITTVFSGEDWVLFDLIIFKIESEYQEDSND